MNRQTTLVVPGVGITTALLVAVIVIEALSVEFSAIVGLPAGLLAGIAVALLVSRRYERASQGVRAVADGGASFGYTVVLLLAVRYVDLAGLESLITLSLLVGVALATAVVVVVVSLIRDRSPAKIG